MAFTTIPSSGLSGNRHSGGSSRRWPGDLPCPDVRFDVASAEADPPRAYRYRPAANDPSVPDSDPRSPRFEPPHLRHRPGDTWIIDRDRPNDPLDPGPFGSPGWAPDNRTGRHRRAELPDPPREAEEPNSSTRRPSPGRGERDQPEAGSEGSGPRPGRGRGDEPPPSSRSRFWGDADDRRRYDFGRLREDAWTVLPLRLRGAVRGAFLCARDLPRAPRGIHPRGGPLLPASSAGTLAFFRLVGCRAWCEFSGCGRCEAGGGTTGWFLEWFPDGRPGFTGARTDLAGESVRPGLGAAFRCRPGVP